MISTGCLCLWHIWYFIYFLCALLYLISYQCKSSWKNYMHFQGCCNAAMLTWSTECDAIVEIVLCFSFLNDWLRYELRFILLTDPKECKIIRWIYHRRHQHHPRGSTKSSHESQKDIVIMMTCLFLYKTG